MCPTFTTVSIGSLLALSVATTGCGSPPELRKQLETLSSWTATLQLAREERGSGAITTTYATQLRDGARSVLEETTRTIGQAAHTAADSSHAAAALDSLNDAIRQLDAESGS
jgi:hypothetical protein